MPTPSSSACPSPAAERLPELAAVHWRPRADARRLDRLARLWTLTTVAHVVPFLVAAIALLILEPLTFPVAVVCLAHAWVIPELYAQRGANVARPRPRLADGPERVSIGLLGDLVGHDARELHRRTGLVPEEGRLGTWLLGEAGALLVRGRTVFCYCVRVDPAAEAGGPDGPRELPSGDRIAHLLLALRADEEGFATVANLGFAGARWRVRRRLRRSMRPALDAVAASERRAGVGRRAEDYPERTMQEESSRPSLAMRFLAIVVLAVAAWILLKFAIGLIAGLATIIVVVVAVAAIVWAIRVL